MWKLGTLVRLSPFLYLVDFILRLGLFLLDVCVWERVSIGHVSKSHGPQCMAQQFQPPLLLCYAITEGRQFVLLPDPLTIACKAFVQRQLLATRRTNNTFVMGLYYSFSLHVCLKSAIASLSSAETFRWIENWRHGFDELTPEGAT